MGAVGENRGTRAGACTDISPTSLHNEEQGGGSARVLTRSRMRRHWCLGGRRRSGAGSRGWWPGSQALAEQANLPPRAPRWAGGGLRGGSTDLGGPLAAYYAAGALRRICYAAAEAAFTATVARSGGKA